jgi:hypothetical protein
MHTVSAMPGNTWKSLSIAVIKLFILLKEISNEIIYRDF